MHLAVELARRRLVETRFDAGFAERVEQAERAHGVDLGGVFRHLERDFDVALGGQVVDLGWLNLGHESVQIVRVEHVPVVQEEPVLVLWLGVLGVDAPTVERARTANHAVHLVALAEQ